MNRLLQKSCLISGPIAFTLFGIALWPLAGMIPLPHPSASADAVLTMYQSRSLGIRLGMILLMLSSILLAPFFAAITVQMKRMEGEHCPLSYAQLLAGACTIVVFFLSGIVLSAAAFRLERSAEAVSMLHDVGFFLLIIPVFPAVLQCLAVGFAIIGDRRSTPLVPAWAGYASMWLGVLLLPGCAIALFKSGPFAWNGLIAFWVPAVLFGMWANMITYLFCKSVDRLEG